MVVGGADDTVAPHRGPCSPISGCPHLYRRRSPAMAILACTGLLPSKRMAAVATEPRRPGSRSSVPFGCSGSPAARAQHNQLGPVMAFGQANAAVRALTLADKAPEDICHARHRHCTTRACTLPCRGCRPACGWHANRPLFLTMTQLGGCWRLCLLGRAGGVKPQCPGLALQGFREQRGAARTVQPQLSGQCCPTVVPGAAAALSQRPRPLAAPASLPAHLPPPTSGLAQAAGGRAAQARLPPSCSTAASSTSSFSISSCAAG